MECRVIGDDGLTRWVLTRASTRPLAGRTVVDGISSNVTARKRDEIQLERERRQLDQAQKIGQIGSWDWDVASNHVTWSEALFGLYGVDPAQYQPEEANRLCIHPDDIEDVATAIKRGASIGAPFIHR
jgi:PAS domain-containing protein